MVLFSFPKVQTWTAKRVTSSINKKYQTDIFVESIGVNYKGDIELHNVFIKDHYKDTLINVKNFSTSIVNFSDLIKGNGELSNVYLEDIYVKMKTYKNDKFDNLRIFFKKFATDKKKPTLFKLGVDDVVIKNGRYQYTSENIKSDPIVFIKNINLMGSNLSVDGFNLDLQSDQLSFVYNNAINVTKLTTKMQLREGVMDFQKIVLESDKKSQLKGNALFTYNPSGMNDFNNLVKLKASIKNSKISTTDLRFFYNEFGFNKSITVSTDFNGVLNNFKLTNLKLKGLSESVIEGDLHLINLMSKNLLKDFKVEGKVNNLTSSKKDLVSLLPNILGKRLPKQLDSFGQVTMIGDLIATPNSIDLKGNIQTELGSVKTILAMNELLNPQKTKYKGNLQVSNFDLGVYSNNKKLGLTSFNLDVDGKGLFRESLNTKIKGVFSKLQYKGYTYKNISITGKLKDPLFDGEILANDPNFNLIFSGLININELENDYDFTAKVNKIDFNKLNLFKRDSISLFKGEVKAKLKGTTIDNVFGIIEFKNTNYNNQNGNYKFTDFKVSSYFDNEKIRTIEVNSPDIVTGKIKGQFKFKNIKKLFSNSLLSLYNKKAVITSEVTEFIDFDFKIYNKIVDLFFPSISFAPKTFIKGRVSSKVSEFKLDFKSPQINFFKNTIEKLNFQVDNTNPSYNTYVTIDKFNNATYPISEFSLLNVSVNDTLYVKSAFKAGKKAGDNYDLNLFHTVNEESNSIVGFQKSYLKIKGNLWDLNSKDDKKHLITFNHSFSEAKVDSIKIVHKNERINFSGVVRDSTYKDFKVRFSEVDLQKITPTIDSLTYKGLVNGNLSILQKKGAYYPESNVTITDFKLNDTDLGKLTMSAVGNSTLTKYVIDSSIVNNKKETPIEVKGNINVAGSEPEIDLSVSLNKFKLQPFSPLGGVVLSKLRGDVNGKVKITGNYKNPNIDGDLFIENGGLNFPYLNVDLNFENNTKVSLSKQKITFNRAELNDTKYKTKGYLNGFISHNRFKDWNLDLIIDSDRILVLDTDEDDNELYYGQAFINGKASITGKTDKLLIAIEATSEKGTKFKIPINDAETIGDNSFIHFVTPQEKKARNLGEKVYFEDVKGLELQFDLDLNRNAEVEVVVDKESGSILKGSGAGTLLIEINTKGKFNMWGDFVAYKGTYDFKYGGLLSKRFEVLPGGSINWDGNPTTAQLNLSAVYKTNANPAILLENSFVNRKIPVEVITSLKGQLLKPDLDFDIKFPQTSSVVRNELDFVLSDRVTKERQALSLVTQGTFYSDALINGNSIVTDNLVEQASSLVSSIFSNDDDKLNIGFDYVTGDRTNPDQEISDRFGVSVTTQISNRILINGKVGVPIGGVNESVVVGDVRVDFLLNKDGNLRATIFNKQNDIQQLIGEVEGYTQGVGISYSYDFDSFKKLLRKVFAQQSGKKTKKSLKN